MTNNNTFSPNHNDFSYWYEKIKNCGIKTPKTIVFPVPKDVIIAFYMEDSDTNVKTVTDWVDSIITKEVTDSIGCRFFTKNSNFSNKFDFKTAINDKYSLAYNLIQINYTALMFGADGCNELVLREIIESDETTTPCIYNGMPLRTEFRVFYDFDNKKVLYTMNYWDYDYCRPALRNKTDQIIFDAHSKTIKRQYDEHLVEVEALIAEKMQNVTDMRGIWSIDVLFDEKVSNNKVVPSLTTPVIGAKPVNENSTSQIKKPDSCFWLIDMAQAQTSAYWNPEYDTTL